MEHEQTWDFKLPRGDFLGRHQRQVVRLPGFASVAVEVEDAWRRSRVGAAPIRLGLLAALPFGFVGPVLFDLA